MSQPPLGTILLVEDDPDDEFLIIRSLRGAKLINPVEVVRDGAAALAWLADKTNPLPVVVLLDLNLPKVSGVDVLRRLRNRKRTAQVPVVVLTSSDMVADIERAYAAGANAYVQKPVPFDAFAAVVRDVGLFWAVLNKPTD